MCVWIHRSCFAEAAWGGGLIGLTCHVPTCFANGTETNRAAFVGKVVALCVGVPWMAYWTPCLDILIVGCRYARRYADESSTSLHNYHVAR